MTTGAKPFLKWVGGKRQLLPELLARVPKKIGTYVEPFVGGGALFFTLANEGRFKQARISDSNPQLINVYRAIQGNLPAVRGYLNELEAKKTAEGYATIRAEHNREWLFGRMVSYARSGKTWDCEAAAWFIFLNRMGFNGLCRYNRKGEFNVPFGRYENPALFDREVMDAARAALNHAQIELCDFIWAVGGLKPGDLVYFDPPYIPASSTAAFTQYVASAFGPEQQARLSNLARDLVSRGVGVLLSNSDTPAARALYTDPVFRVETVQARRAINSNAAKRGAVGELLISANL